MQNNAKYYLEDEDGNSAIPNVKVFFEYRKDIQRGTPGAIIFAKKCNGLVQKFLKPGEEATTEIDNICDVRYGAVFVPKKIEKAEEGDFKW